MLILKQTSRHASDRDITVTRCTTRSMTTDASRRAVFETAELLETILLCLPTKTVFAAMRVSRQFHDIVATSPKLQEKLFLRLSSSPSKLWIQSKTYAKPRFPMIEGASGGSLEIPNASDIPCNAWRRGNGEVPVFTVAELNPLLKLRYHERSAIFRF